MDKICLNCEKVFTVSNNKRGQKRKYCSRDCVHQSQRISKFETGITQVGYLTILERIIEQNHSQRHKYKCRCVCGNIVIRLYSTLSKCLSDGWMSSCGCLENQNRGLARTIPKTVEFSKYFSSTYLTYLRKKARSRNLIFLLTLNDLDNLYDKQNGQCFYTGAQLILPDRSLAFRSNYQNTNVSVDRLDSTQPYILSNVVLCISQVNMCKQTLLPNEFINLCKQVAQNFS